MLHDSINQQIRHKCRACHNICYTPDGSAPEPAEGYRCEACEAVNYERRDFDKSLPPLDAGSAEAASPIVEGAGIGGPSPSQDSAAPAGDFTPDSEARPSDEPKSADVVTPEPEPVAEAA